MVDLVLSQPGIYLYPLFALLLLLGALWTGEKRISNGAKRLAPCRLNPAFRNVYAACSADYTMKFDKLGKRIQSSNADREK